MESVKPIKHVYRAVATQRSAYQDYLPICGAKDPKAFYDIGPTTCPECIRIINEEKLLKLIGGANERA